jgi:hypothetical protein
MYLYGTIHVRRFTSPLLKRELALKLGNIKKIIKKNDKKE